MSEEELKIVHRIHRLRDFYNDLILYGLVNVGLVIIWALSGGGYFWPIWVMIGWGIGFARRALELNLIPNVDRLLPHLSEDWEKEQLQKYRAAKTRKDQSQGAVDHTTPPPIKPTSKGK